MRVALLAVFALALLAACAGGEQAPPSEVVGVITEIESDGGDVTALEVRADNEETYEIRIADDVDYGFDVDHLYEHEAAGDAVRCRLEERDGHLYALSIEDA